MKTKPQTAWAVVGPDDRFWIYGFRRDKETAKMAIRLPTGTPWPELERKGYRIARVEIREVREES